MKAVRPSRSDSPKNATSPSGDFKQQLIESVVGPVRAAILRSSWPVRALVLGLMVSAGLLWETAQHVDWGLVGDMGMAARHPGTLKLTTSEADEFDQAISTLSSSLSVKLRDAYNVPSNHDVWAVSQMTIALPDAKEADGKAIAELLNKMRIPACDCWKYQASAPFQDIASVNWVAFALAKSGQKLPAKDIKLILDNQHDGWWPAFTSATNDRNNASTYATAFSLLALNEQMRLGIEEPLRQRVQDSLEAGKGWLLHQIGPKTARWYDYPNIDSGYRKQPIGLSGLVIHVLHRLGIDTIQSKDIDESWMRDLPADIPGPTEMLSNTVNVAMANNAFVQDTTRQISLPWIIIATVDAYQNGTLRDQARASNWFRRLASQIGPQLRVVMTSSWASAELAIALRYLRRKQHAGADVV
jgi:hypothetical protein